MSAPPVLVSHALCPYVQRAAIVLLEKRVPFERRDINLANKPDWFMKVSPLGKTPVLLVGDVAIFESAVICEYLDETVLPHLHPADALQRARHRSWMEFGSALLNAIAAFYNAADEEKLMACAGGIRARFVQIETALGEGPYFAGTQGFHAPDAALHGCGVARMRRCTDAVGRCTFFTRTRSGKRLHRDFRVCAFRILPAGAPPNWLASSTPHLHTSGLTVFSVLYRPKSRSALHSTEAPFSMHSAAMRAS